jgi:predicted anti-sigma-YlaC factor YlaD
MECKEVLKYIDMYFEGRLDDEIIKKVNNHLNRCSSCKKEYEEMELVFEALSNHSIVQPPPDFVDNIMNKINEEKPKANRISQKIKIKIGTGLIAAGLLIAVLNMSTVAYRIEDFSARLYTSTIEANQRVFKPLSQITNTFANLVQNTNIASLKELE